MELFREQKFKRIETLDELEALHRAEKLFGYQNVVESAYHAGPGLSQSILKGYGKTPAHARMAMKGEVSRTDAMRFGSACHVAVFEPRRYLSEYAVAPGCDRRTKAGKERWEAFLASHPGQEVLTEDDAATIAGIQGSLQTHPYFKYISDGIGYPELAYYWKMGGLFCKARFDWITSTAVPLEQDETRIIFDLKTTEYGTSPGDIERTIRSLGYDIQASWYLSAITDAAFVFIFAEKRPPYSVAFYQVGPKMREEGHAKIDQMLSRHQECTLQNQWLPHTGGIILGD